MPFGLQQSGRDAANELGELLDTALLLHQALPEKGFASQRWRCIRPGRGRSGWLALSAACVSGSIGRRWRRAKFQATWCAISASRPWRDVLESGLRRHGGRQLDAGRFQVGGHGRAGRRTACDIQLNVSGARYDQPVWIGEVGMGLAPVPGDYDGDGLADPAVYNRATGLWAMSLSGRGYQPLVVGMFGGAGYLPVPADYDGDGITDPAIYAFDTAYWQVLMSGTIITKGYSTWCGDYLGNAGGMPVPA
ncbi:MAG: VCBS repeat-containing protein, partial [Verrucomicrobiota bacterium]